MRNEYHRRRRPTPVAWRSAAPVGVVVLAASALMAWDIERPALWLDETASTVAGRRTWSDVWLLRGGSDAPLVPYYAVLKASRALDPAPNHLGHDLGLLMRWPSAAAVIIAVGLLTWWLQRVASTGVALGAAAVLLLSVGVSRYGQEARPYALVLLLAVLATVTWWAAIIDRRRALLPLYAVEIAGLVTLHELAAGLVLAQVVAAAIMRVDSSPGPNPPGHPRGRRVAHTVAAAGAGLLLAAPLTVLAVDNGHGATRFASFSLFHLGAAAASLATVHAHREYFLVAVLLLAVAGISRWRSAAYGNLVRLATAWALAPTIAWAGAVWLRPNLLIGRYLLYTVPGWAILAGIGLTASAGMITRPLRALGPTTGSAAAATLCAAVVIVLAVAQRPALEEIRTSAGHSDDDIRPSVAAVDGKAYRSLPIYISPGNDAVELQAYDPRDDARLIDVVPQADRASIWPTRRPPAVIRERLRLARRIIVLERRDRSLPGSILADGYRVATTLPSGGGWTACVAVRRPLSDPL